MADGETTVSDQVARHYLKYPSVLADDGVMNIGHSRPLRDFLWVLPFLGTGRVSPTNSVIP
jgi:hypothetical protein